MCEPDGLTRDHFAEMHVTRCRHGISMAALCKLRLMFVRVGGRGCGGMERVWHVLRRFGMKYERFLGH